MVSTFSRGFSIVGFELELVEVGETQIEGLDPYDEEGVEWTHHVLEKRFGWVENLHGCMRGKERKKGEDVLRFVFEFQDPIRGTSPN